MKNILIALGLLALTACNSENKTSTKVETVVVDSNEVYAARVESAKLIMDSVNVLMTKGITKTMARNEVNKKVKPLMDRYFVMFKTMRPSDTLIVHQYRIDKINEMIDLQIKQSN